jgi:hypothetical protein
MSGRLHEEEKWGIISSWKKHGNMAAVARNLSYSYKIVKYWIDRYKKSGNMTARTSTGRKKAISTEAARLAVDLLKDVETFGTSDLAEAEIHRLGLTSGAKPVHMTTLTRAVVAQSTTDGDKLELAEGEPDMELTTDTKQKSLAIFLANLSTN